MIATPDYRALLDTAIAEARQGLAEGGIPIGAALYHQDGRLLGCGHNRRVQEGDPSVHGETRWMPSDIASFIRSYLPATEENTSPTSFCFSATGTSRNPKWVVPGSPEGRAGSLMAAIIAYRCPGAREAAGGRPLARSSA